MRLCMFVVVCLHAMARGQNITDVAQAVAFLKDYNIKVSESLNARVKASWTYNTNLTDENADKMIDENLRHAAFAKEAAKNASLYAWQDFEDPMKREFFKITDIGTAAMADQTKLERLNTVLSELQKLYSTGKGCVTSDRCLPLDPDLTNILANSRDIKELEGAWKGWRDATGKKMRTLFTEYVNLHNEAIQDSGYSDTGEYWRSWYESQNFRTDVAALFEQLKPLYQQMHAYTRTKLIEKYGKDNFPSTGHIPAHLLGNMWAQQWNNLYSDLVPIKGKPSVDITEELKRQNFTAVKMFEVSDAFFTSMGMKAMPQSFWENSMLEKPTDGRDVVCHASAWDFYDTEDFRIKQCTEPTHSQMVTVHHEMGHVEYYLQYKHQPVLFRRGANPGFHEGIADVASLSFQTPKHLHAIGFLPTLEEDDETDINFLFNMALQKIAFLPFGYLIDQWRWDVFSGATKPEEYNAKWWDLRCSLQGVSPPVKRTEEDFDPGAKFHIPGNVAYIRYFVSFVIQFQFHKVLCEEAGHTGPLHKCDIYNSTEAGDLFSGMLGLGSSKPWPEAMQNITGQNKMDAQPLMDYFQPLLDWLKIQNAGVDVEWSATCPEFVDAKASATSIHFSGFVCLFLLVVAGWLNRRGGWF